MRFQTTVVKRINQVQIYFKIILLYFFIYNTVYGWNSHPIDETEKILDYVFKFSIGYGLGWITSIGLDFMKLMANYVLIQLNREV